MPTAINNKINPQKEEEEKEEEKRNAKEEKKKCIICFVARDGTRLASQQQQQSSLGRWWNINCRVITFQSSDAMQGDADTNDSPSI